jgi:zinc D-Ala-D-Ala dipeptidase
MAKTAQQRLSIHLATAIMLLTIASCNNKHSQNTQQNQNKPSQAPQAQPTPHTKPKPAATPPNNNTAVVLPPALELSPNGSCPYDSLLQAQGLVNIKTLDSSIQVQLKYSSTDNFVGADVYGCISNAYLQKTPAQMLAKASQYLQKQNPNLRLLVYDAARPHSIQKILWDALPQYPPKIRENYVASPSQGSIHNYGSAVDLTIANTTGQPLDMGTKYDYFGQLAYPKYEQKLLAQGQLSQQQITNRLLLRQTMQQAGFSPIQYEWWHFNAISRKQAKATYRRID